MRPVDLFSPHYSSAILNYILTKYNANEQQDLKLIEVNGRNGTNAKVILDYLQENHSDIYQHTQYYIANPNKSFLERQKQIITPYHKNITLIPKSITNWKIPEEIKSKNAIIMGIEVLDTLPHDKVKYNEDTKEWEEIFIEQKSDNQLVEMNKKIKSSSVEEALEYYNNRIIEIPKITLSKRFSNIIEKSLRKIRKIRTNEYTDSIFLPTGGIELIKYINENIPNNSIIFTSIYYLSCL